MFQFALSIFLSAFLLFQIQPMIGKFLLPWFGGTPAVWSTAMLFFQALLTGGYAYAYWLIGRIRAERQGKLHAGLLGVTALVVMALGLFWPSPITPSAAWKPDVGAETPIWQLFVLLAVSVGLPYFMLASNGPLMQAWFSRLFPAKSYARLYSLSNVGSLLGLLCYPFLTEPWLTLRAQGWTWALGFVLFAILVGGLALRVGKRPETATEAAGPVVERTPKPSAPMLGLWIILGATPSIFLLAVTNQITQEVAVIPFLWILPLALYLLSFILTFSDGPWVRRRTYALLFALVSLMMLRVMIHVETTSIIVQISTYCLLLFLACMIAHGELYLLRPSAEHLTTFYLMVSVGGALGGIFVNLIAPYIFTGYWEFYLAWLLTTVVVITSLLPRWMARTSVRVGVLWGVSVATVAGLIFSMNSYSDALFVNRNFYGILRVRTWQSPNGFGDGYAMIHGATIHGVQYLAPDLRDQPTTYYVQDGGAGLVLLNHPRRGQGLRVGVLGLGAGTLATYAQPGDVYRFYEINPTVVEIAEGQGGYFSFLKDSQAQVSVVTDDARLALERELAEGQPQNFDVLVLDTFSSDSIPVHLVTKESFGIYLQHLKPDGVLAAHVSNRYLDLRPVLWGLAHEYGLTMQVVERSPIPGSDGFPSIWVLLAREPVSQLIPALQSHITPYDGSSTPIRLWTDDYSNLFQILK
ncbi:MAG: fused MFS/spermidine synthase [Chloroflexi bacterium]|nr:fused MFS/spermidine synthase [Chloroflexota bacterium]